MRYLLAAGAVLPLCASIACAGTVSPFLLADQTLDQVVLLKDLNGDGDTDDAGEATVFFDAANASGLTAPTGNVFSLTQGSGGAVYLGDGDSDTVYRVRDRDGDGTANGAGEARVWFSGSANASGLALNTPNGIAEGPDGALYVVEADTVGVPSGDYVYRMVDLNGDGDANDAGEVTPWLDLKAINAASSPFSIKFDGDTAYVTDTAGGTPDVIYAVRDTDGSGTIDPAEVRTFATEGSGTTALFDFALAVGDGSVWTWQWQAANGFASVFRLTDIDASGVIDQPDETDEVWNTTLLAGAYDFLAGFDMAYDALTGDILIMSNDSDAIGDWVIRLSDLDGDGAFWSDGEWKAVLARSAGGIYPDRPRALTFYTAPVPLPPMLPAMALALGGVAILRRRPRGL